MTYNSTLFNLAQIHLEIERSTQTQAWQYSQTFATPTSRWNAYLNALSLETVLQWLREDYEPQSRPFLTLPALNSIWEVVNGSAIVLDTLRLALIPSEAIDSDEFRVPQEWVDLPNWVADYYLALSVNPDDGWIRLNGWAAHQQLKAAHYDATDRTYWLEETQITADFGTFWATRQLCPDASTRSPIASLPSVSHSQAEQLLDRLGDSTNFLPRLSIPFELWGALLQQDSWRQRLTARRRGALPTRSVLRWLQEGFTELTGWQTMQFQPSEAGARGNQMTPIPALAKPLTIADRPYELRIYSIDPTTNTWRFELCSVLAGGTIPAGYRLRLLTETLQPFPGNEDTATQPVESLYLEVALESDEGVIWEIDPTPDAFQQEVLRF